MFGSTYCGAGQVKQPRTLARRVVDAVAERRAVKCKPWKGPLPLATSSPSLSLGDIWVTDSRSHGGKETRKRLSDFSGAQMLSVAVESPALRETKCFDPDAEFEFRNGVTIQLTGPKMGAGSVQMKAQRVFQWSNGLGMLVMRAGRPIGFPIRRLSTVQRLGSRACRAIAWGRLRWQECRGEMKGPMVMAAV